MAGMHFLTQFTHLSRQIRVQSRKKKHCLGKTVLNMMTQICEQMAYVSTKLLLEKSAKTKQNKKNKKI